jgi:predicted DNA-binding transcriptional regulator YafY
MYASAAHSPETQRKRRTDAPSEHVARIGWMLITLLCDGVLDYGRCIDLFGISHRQFQRDLRQIRELGGPHGFAITHSKSGRVFLSTTSRRVCEVSAPSRDATATLARLAAAFGGPIASEMREAIGDSAAEAGDGFLQVRDANEHVTDVFDKLKAAAHDCARVEFEYTPARGSSGGRRAEPYHIVARAGRYYLVAYDLVRRDWRLFALDAIHGAVRRAGTFTRRPVPDRFLAERAVGWIAGLRGGEVTIRLSRVIAAAVGARTWQEGQRFRTLPGGGAELTLRFDDFAEAVRFALGFGAEAAIIEPPEAVTLSRETAERILRAYEPSYELHRKLTG